MLLIKGAVDGDPYDCHNVFKLYDLSVFQQACLPLIEGPAHKQGKRVQSVLQNHSDGHKKVCLANVTDYIWSCSHHIVHGICIFLFKVIQLCVGCCVRVLMTRATMAALENVTFSFGCHVMAEAA